MSTRYIKGERFRVRSTGYAPTLIVDESTQEQNIEAVLALFEMERRR